MRTLEQLTDAYVALDSRDIGSREGLLDIRSALSELAQKVKEFRAEVEQALIENIDAHGDVNLGDKRMYVGVDRTYKCSDSRAVFVALLEATGGDEALMCEHLASGCWKPGACKVTLADRFSTLFSEDVAKDLKTGSAKRMVKVADPQFAGKRGGE
jgi:hypothetical protein